MANLTNTTTNNKGNFPPFSIGSKRDRFTAILITKLAKLDLKLTLYGVVLAIVLAFFWIQALSKAGAM